MRSRAALWGYVLVLGSAASFGFLPVFLTNARATGMSNIMTLTWRYIIAASVFLPYAIWRDRWRPSRRGVAGLLVVGLVLSPLQAVLYMNAVYQAGPALATLLLHLYPVFVCFGAVALRRQRWSWWIPVVLAVALVGIALTLGPTEALSMVGLGIGFACGLEYAVYLLAVDVVAPLVPSRTLAAGTFLGTAVAFAATGGVTGQLSMPAGKAGWLAVALLGLVCTIAAVWLLYEGMTYIGAATASLTSMTEAVWALLASVIWLELRLTWIQWLGAAIVIVAALAGVRLTSKPR
ncbi:MAG: DMT family transporter [Propionibacteriaceae bacterium]